MPQPESETGKESSEKKSLPQVIGTIASLLERATRGEGPFSRGDVAALRRMNSESHSVPAFWRLHFGHIAEGRRSGPHLEGRWALVIKCMAEMTSKMASNVYSPGIDSGRALRQANFSEARLARFLNARGPMFQDQFERLSNFLAAKGQPVDWGQLARLVFAEGRDEAEAEKHRRAIARGFYAAQAEEQTEPDATAAN